MIRRYVFASALGALLLAWPWIANAQGTLKKVATVSSTIGVSPGRICAGSPGPTGPQAVLGCSASAPELIGGGISASGVITATEFRGDVAAVNVLKGNETCSSSTDYGKMVFGDANMHLCTPYGWRSVAMSAGSAPPDVSWTGGYFVLIPQFTNANFGGRSGAATLCVNQLKSTNWKGKANANLRGLLNTSKVRAFICDGSNCENGQPSTTYRFATGGSITLGGDSFTTDGSGIGPGDNNDWGANTKFGVDSEGAPHFYWTGRNAGTSTAWSTTSHTNTCSGWASTSGNGRYGYGFTGTGRWNQNNTTCASLLGLICFVDP